MITGVVAGMLIAAVLIYSGFLLGAWFVGREIEPPRGPSARPGARRPPWGS